MGGDTIAALSSPPGRALRGIVRLSGPAALAIAAEVAGLAPPVKRGVVRGEFRAAGVACPCLVLAMPAPASYTREDVAELHLPGAGPLLAEAMGRVLLLGAREAGPGEFTRRAVENGRIDPGQAEAVMDLIRARSDAELRRAAARLAGEPGRRLDRAVAALRDLAAEVEAAIDFQEHDIPALGAAEAAARAQGIAALLARAAAGVPAAEDVPRVVLAGAPNAGKSSLFNALTGAGAIVSPHPGTTRDAIEADMVVGSVAFRLIDTPGDGQFAGGPDAAAAERGRAERGRADLVIALAAPGDRVPAADGRTLVVFSKADLVGPAPKPGPAVSALTGAGVGRLRARIALALRRRCGAAESALSARERDAALRASLAAGRAADAAGQGEEFMALELREALDALGEITGETGPEELLDRIFARFCIGK